MRDKLSSLSIIFNVTKCVFSFYCIYFGCSSLVFATYSLENFDGTIPFDFETWIDLDKCCTYERKELVNTISMVVTFPISGAVYGLLVLNWVWDYAITTAIIHFLLSCLVCLDFPYNWSWWVCLGVGLLLMVASGELVSFLRRYRNRSRIVVPIIEQPVKNYLHK